MLPSRCWGVGERWAKDTREETKAWPAPSHLANAEYLYARPLGVSIPFPPRSTCLFVSPYPACCVCSFGSGFLKPRPLHPVHPIVFPASIVGSPTPQTATTAAAAGSTAGVAAPLPCCWRWLCIVQWRPAAAVRVGTKVLRRLHLPSVLRGSR